MDEGHDALQAIHDLIDQQSKRIDTLGDTSAKAIEVARETQLDVAAIKEQMRALSEMLKALNQALAAGNGYAAKMARIEGRLTAMESAHQRDMEAERLTTAVEHRAIREKLDGCEKRCSARQKWMVGFVSLILGGGILWVIQKAISHIFAVG